jgi:hypothetical protein
MRRRSATYSFDSRHGSNGIARHPEPLLGGRSASGSTTGDKCFVPAHRKGSRWPGRRPEANHDSCVERFIRTLKENLLWVRRFATIEELRQALHAFKDTYNRTWIVGRHGYRTPAQVRADQIGLAQARPPDARAMSHNCGPLHMSGAGSTRSPKAATPRSPRQRCSGSTSRR